VNLWKSYHLANDVNDALLALAASVGEARVIAGGSDLLLDLQQKRQAPVDTLVDVTAIQEMDVIDVRQDYLYIGAATPLDYIFRSELVQKHAMALHEAVGLIGGPQVRNTASLGGNVAHALPAADGTIALLALDAQAEIASLCGRSWRNLEDLFLGPGLSALHPREELLTAFKLPVSTIGDGSAFQRVMRPQGVAIAILNMGIWLRRSGNTIAEVRIALGPAGPKPFRARGTENDLHGKDFTRGTILKAIDTLLEESHFRTSPQRATAQYRRHLAAVLLQDTITVAWERSGNYDTVERS